MYWQSSMCELLLCLLVSFTSPEPPPPPPVAGDSVVLLLACFLLDAATGGVIPFDISSCALDGKAENLHQRG